jgi:hypothetical protein
MCTASGAIRSAADTLRLNRACVSVVTKVAMQACERATFNGTSCSYPIDQ